MATLDNTYGTFSIKLVTARVGVDGVKTWRVKTLFTRGVTLSECAALKQQWIAAYGGLASSSEFLYHFTTQIDI